MYDTHASMYMYTIYIYIHMCLECILYMYDIYISGYVYCVCTLCILSTCMLFISVCQSVCPFIHLCAICLSMRKSTYVYYLCILCIYTVYLWFLYILNRYAIMYRYTIYIRLSVRCFVPPCIYFMYVYVTCVYISLVLPVYPFAHPPVRLSVRLCVLYKMYVCLYTV